MGVIKMAAHSLQLNMVLMSELGSVTNSLANEKGSKTLIEIHVKGEVEKHVLTRIYGIAFTTA